MNLSISSKSIEDVHFATTPSIDRSTSSANHNTNDFHRRKNTVSRSMYECGSSKDKDRINKLSERFNGMTEMQARKLSLDRREVQLNVVADEAIRQVEEMLRLKTNCVELSAENCQLKDEVEKLREAFHEATSELKEKKDSVDEWREYQSQLQSQLEWNRRKLAQFRLQNERIKADKQHVVLGDIVPNFSHVNAVPEVDEQGIIELRQECEDITKQIEEMKATIDRLLIVNINLCSLMRDEENQAVNGQRETKDLLRVIRLTKNEKMVWQQYCSRVLSKIMSDVPELLECNCRCVDSAFHCDHENSTWQAYALTLHKALVEYCPKLASDLLDKPKPVVQTPSNLPSESNTKSFKSRNGQRTYHVPRHLTA